MAREAISAARAGKILANGSGKSYHASNPFLVRLIEAVAELQELETRRFSRRDRFFHSVVATMHHLFAAVLECEEAGVSAEEIRSVLTRVREIQARSPFLNRLQRWPRGYAGDFETIEYLVRANPASCNDTIEGVCERYALTCAGAQQHRNKLQKQAELIRHTIVHASVPSRILVLAGGSCIDIQMALDAIGDKPFELVINDSDLEALRRAQEELRSVPISFLHGNILELLRRPEKLGSFDLIIAGGLFDYLPDRQILFVLRHIYSNILRSGGRFFFTNIARGNPYRVWMEYLVDWHLIERDRDDLIRIAKNAEIPEEALHFDYDPTSLTLLVEVRRNEPYT